MASSRSGSCGYSFRKDTLYAVLCDLKEKAASWRHISRSTVTGRKWSWWRIFPRWVVNAHCRQLMTERITERYLRRSRWRCACCRAHHFIFLLWCGRAGRLACISTSYAISCYETFSSGADCARYQWNSEHLAWCTEIQVIFLCHWSFIIHTSSWLTDHSSNAL